MLYAHISCLQNTCPSLIRKQGKDVSVCPLCVLVGISQTLKNALRAATRFTKR